MLPPIYPSLTRISDMDRVAYDVAERDRDDWATGDYILLEVTAAGHGDNRMELPSGRLSAVFPGYGVVGALGHRFATLELTGSWEAIEADGRADILTGGGLVGRVTSRSTFEPRPIEARYRGHLTRDGRKLTMRGSVTAPPDSEFSTPTVLIVGTSMSAGKTTIARVVIRQFRELGLSVVGAKLTGAGMYRDVLAMKDAGAQHVLDFVDVGLPSTVVPEEDFREAAGELLARIGALGCDVAVIEAGASPLEPYNGGAAVEMIEANVKMTILAATDPYAVLGIQEAFGRPPDLVTGPTANTLAGVALVKELTGADALDAHAPDAGPALRHVLEQRFM
jgi:hypothetical protein